VGLNGDRLTVTSNSYGSTSKVTIGIGSALTPLGFTGSETDQGVDVAGHYLVNGQMETATGSGQFLVGASTNAHTAELQVRVTMTPTQVGAGVTGDLSVTRGVASGLDALLSNLLDPITGRMQTINESFESKVEDIKEEIARQTALAQTRRDRLLQQFVNLERTVSQMQSLGAFLATQLSQINNLNAARR
jgi:flagellar hook-associated protein 2